MITGVIFCRVLPGCWFGARNTSLIDLAKGALTSGIRLLGVSSVVRTSRGHNIHQSAIEETDPTVDRKRIAYYHRNVIQCRGMAGWVVVEPFSRLPYYGVLSSDTGCVLELAGAVHEIAGSGSRLLKSGIVLRGVSAEGAPRQEIGELSSSRLACSTKAWSPLKVH